MTSSNLKPKYDNGDSIYYMGFIEGKEVERERILMIIEDWWNSPDTCSGKPHCNIDECDICVNCLADLIRNINNGKEEKGKKRIERKKKK